MKNLKGEQLKQSILEISDVSMQDSIFETSYSSEKNVLCPFCDCELYFDNEDSFLSHIEEHPKNLSYSQINKKMSDIKNNIEKEYKKAVGLKLTNEALKRLPFLVPTMSEEQVYTDLKKFFNFQ